jgi:protein-S-isoprenylcysteine O-methyltransferase Ste14
MVQPQPQPESPYEVVILVASVVVVIAASVVVVRLDERRLERRLDEERLERAWPPASRDNALIGLSLLAAPLLGLFAVWFHFFRTRSRGLWPPWRWSPTGFFLGLAAVLVVMLANALVVLTLAYALGLSLDG